MTFYILLKFQNMSKFSKKEIKNKIDNNYQEITDFKEEMISDKKQKISKFTIKGTLKKEQNPNRYKPKNQFEDLVINQLFNINLRLDIFEKDILELKQDVNELKQDVSILQQDVSILKQDVNKIKNTPTIKKELLS